MYEISRRDIILSAAGAALLFGLDKRVALIGAAQAQKAPETKPFHKFKVGDVEVVNIYEGALVRPQLDGIVKNASVDDVKAAIRAAGLPDDKFTNPITVTLLRSGGKTILIDSGTGGQMAPTAGLLLTNMQAAGIDPKSIDTILLTHFHPDHIFGLMAKETNAQVYPNAQVMMPEPEFKFWTDSGVFTKIPEGMHGLAKRIQATLPTWKNASQFAWGAEVLPGITALSTPGHTHGHTSFLVASAGKQLIVQGDVTTAPYLFAKNPQWYLGFDMDGPTAEATRRKLYDRAIADKALVSGYHWGIPGTGTMAKDGNGYAYTPVG